MAEDALHGLGLRRRLSLTVLHAAVQDAVGREIRVIAHPLPAVGPSGFCISTADTDYVVYDQVAPPTLRLVIICHELAHVLFKDGAAQSPPELATLLAPYTPEGRAAHAAWHSQYTEDVERRAEIFSSVAVERMTASEHVRAVGDADGALVARLVNALEAAPDG